MDLTGWGLVVILTKLCVYLGVAASIGGPFSLLLVRDRSFPIKPIQIYVSGAAIIGLLASVLSFYFQVGLLAEEGLVGIFSPLYREILWSSSVGNSTFARIAGFAMVILSTLIATHRKEAAKTFIGASRNLLAASCYLLACGWLLYSFTPVGHTALLHWTYCLTLAVHVFLIAWWIGSLWPLLLACSLLPRHRLHKVMRDFGRIAVTLVLILIIAGSTVAFQLLGSPSELLSSLYGRVFTAKLILVAGLLLLALRHKTRLVPALLESEDAAERLARSIKFEIVIGVAVLLVTAFLTTSVGPSHGM